MQVRYPAYFTPDLKHLLRNMLQIDVDRRYGILKNGSRDITQHNWFSTMDWDALVHKRVCT